MLFRKKPDSPASSEEPAGPPVGSTTLELLETLQKSGVQLLVRLGGPEVYTSEVVGLGREGFFIDTLSPPSGDARVQRGTSLEIETLVQGMTHIFEVAVLGKVQFIDELPAYKVAYPSEIRSERRRKSPRVDTRGDASLSFLLPFACDAPVVNLSEGGLAFEYPAELGRLRKGAVVRDVLLELGAHPVITVQGRVVGNVVAELGGISLPRRYRTSLSFQSLEDRDAATIRAYLEELRGVDVRA